MADPITAAIAYVGAEIGGEVGATLIIYSTEIAAVVTAAAAIGSFQSMREQQRRARNQAQDAHNASLQDRYIRSRGATEPRQLVLGRQRVSGPLVGPFSYGANKEHLTFILPLGAHEIDAVEAVYFDDEQVILSGANVVGINRRDEFTISAATGTFTIRTPAKAGTVTAVAKYGSTATTLTVGSVTGTSVAVSGADPVKTGTLVISYQPDPSPYAPTKSVDVRTTTTLNGAGNGSVTAAAPVKAGSVTVTYSTGVVDGTDTDLTSFASVAGNVITIAGVGFGGTVTVTYQTDDSTPRARVRIFTGAPGQVADATMIANLPGIWTSAHVGNAVAYLVVELDYDQEAFPSGIPNVSALVRGAKVYDPRTGLTAWSENPALLMRHATITAPWGPLTASLVGDASIIAAANACDVSASYVVNGRTYTRATYTAGLVVKAGTRCVDVLNDLSTAMAGKWTFVDGLLRVKAGAYSTPLQTLDETWLAAGAISIQPRSNRPDVFNVVTGKFADELQDYQVLAYPRVASAPYITEDGRELPHDVQFNAVTFTGQAQQIAATVMRDARQGLRVSLTCNMRAFAVEVFDNIYVSLARYGWVNKVFEVLDVAFSMDGIVLQLKETDLSIWALGTSFSATDPAPNTLLPAPFQVQDIAGLALSSGSSSKANTEGVTASWTAAVDPGVRESGGGFEIRYGLATLDDTQWNSVTVEGTQTQVQLNAVRPGTIILAKIRGFKVSPGGVARGRWSLPVLHKVGDNAILTTTPGLVPNAATETFIQNDNGPYTSSGSLQAKCLINTFVNSVVAPAVVYIEMDLSYTNSSGSSKEVAVEGGAQVNHAGSWGFVGASRVVKATVPNGANWYYGIQASVRWDSIATGGANEQFQAYFNDVAGATANVTVTNIRLRVEYLKR